MATPMIDARRLELLHAEIDGELDPHERAELARALLADPATRAARQELQRLCARLDGIGQAEPPAELVDSVLSRLPTRPRAQHSPLTSVPASARARWSSGNWRYAAMLAGVMVAGALIFRMTDGQLAPATEVSGTLAGARAAAILDSASISGGGASGSASLIRDGGGLQLAVDLVAGAPIDLQVASGDHTLTINGLGAGRTVVGLPASGDTGQPVQLSFRVDGRQVASARLSGKAGN
jgi:hypothetical protein